VGALPVPAGVVAQKRSENGEQPGAGVLNALAVLHSMFIVLVA
jgi:hypothetical protein